MNQFPVTEFESFLNDNKKLRMVKNKGPWHIELLPDEKPYHPEVLLKNISNEMYLIADLHIGDPIENWTDKRDKIIATINATVSKDDHLLIVGDLSAHTNTANLDDVRNTIAMLNCRNLYLILGNNDQYDIDTYVKMGFLTVTDKVYWKNYVITHCPIPVYGNQINIHGHMHEEIQYINVDWHNHINIWDDQYVPIKLGKAIELFNSGYYKGVTINDKEELEYHKNEKYFGTEESIVTEACKNVHEARKFVQEVGKLAKKYDANYFVVTDGASGTNNNGNPAVKVARDAVAKWERENGFDDKEDWRNDPSDMSHYRLNSIKESTIPDEYYSDKFSDAQIVFNTLSEREAMWYVGRQDYRNKKSYVDAPVVKYRRTLIKNQIPVGTIEVRGCKGIEYQWVGVFIGKDYRHQGYSKILFNHMLDDYKPKGKIRWHVEFDNKVSQHTAESLGFKQVPPKLSDRLKKYEMVIE